MSQLSARSFKSIGTLAFLIVFVWSAVGCATTSGSGRVQQKSLSDHLKAYQYSDARRLLDALYSDYNNSPEAESRMVVNVDVAVSKLPSDNERELLRFIELYRSTLPGKYFEAKYFLKKGLTARGEAYTSKTSPEKLSAMREAVDIAIRQFDAVLEQDPSNYLAHTYKGVAHAYVGTRAEKETEFRSAIALKPESYRAWSEYLWYNHPRWGGSYKKLDKLLLEMSAQQGKNPKLRRLKGVVLADKADRELQRGNIEKAEKLVFEALEFGLYWRYESVVDGLFRKIQISGDRAGACRISRKYNKVNPRNTRYKQLVRSC